MEYNTSQKRAILDYFEANPNKQVSIEQIFDSVKAKTGKSTVYRLVNSFVKEGLIRRLRDEVNMQIVYQLLKADDDCASHFHMKCLNCGKIFHLKCDQSNQLQRHVLTEHNFKISSGKSTIYGFCRDCNIN
ncbi:MAG: transcriptional repressor [bacterium]|nr:transcriptional repressor [bacterium]